MPKTTSLDLRDLTEPFNAWCAKRRISRSLAIRQLVKAAIGNDEQLSCLPPAGDAPVAGEWDGLAPTAEDPAHRFVLRLTKSQREFLRVRAAAAGISCSRYIVAALTARDSDAREIAGKDAVEALVRSNDLLAETVLKLSAWRLREASSGADFLRELQGPLREHLARAAAVVSQVEQTRVGRGYQGGRVKKRADNAKPGGRGQGGRALG
jgi:hypothetical protein